MFHEDIDNFLLKTNKIDFIKKYGIELTSISRVSDGETDKIVFSFKDDLIVEFNYDDYVVIKTKLEDFAFVKEVVEYLSYYVNW